MARRLWSAAAGPLCNVLRSNATQARASVDDVLERGIAMLKSKGVLANNPEEQAFKFKMLRTSSLPQYQAARESLKLLMTTEHDRNLDDQEHSDRSKLQHFDASNYPGFTFFFVDNEETRVQRHQPTGLCYLHASAVAQYYAIWHTKQAECRAARKKAREAGEDEDAAEAACKAQHKPHEMIDITQYVLTYVDGDALWRYIYESAGGSSHSALKSLLKPDSYISGCRIKEVPELLHAYGPILVSGFEVKQDFMDQACLEHRGQPSGERIGLHAMVIVGYKRQEDGKLLLLVQNWWAKKQFVVMDEEYIKPCTNAFFFVETPQHGVPEELPTIAGHILETETLLSMQERLPAEM